MSTIVTRAGKGSPLTNTEVDANFTNLNTDKYQAGDDITAGAGSFTSLTASGDVGLGTASPKTNLQVGNSTATVGVLLAGVNESATSSQLLFGDNTSGQDPYESGMGLRFDSLSNALHIDDNYNSVNNSLVSISRDTGKVGIGTSSPTKDLHVNGDALIEDGLQIGVSQGGISQSALDIRGTNAEQGNFVASVTAGVMDVTSVNNATLAVGDVIYSANAIPAHTFIKSLGTGSGGVGTYNLSQSFDLNSVTLRNSAKGKLTLSITNADTSLRAGQPIGTIEFNDADSANDGAKGFIVCGAQDTTPSSYLAFGVNHTGQGEHAREAARIDEDGNFLLNTITPNSNLDHIELRADGQFRCSSVNARIGTFTSGAGSNEEAIVVVNRTGSDGSMLNLQQGGTTQLRFHSTSGDKPIIVENEGKGIKLNPDSLQPRTYNNGTYDNQMSLGADTTKFKDLYLGGGVFLGGTLDANKLDDYETGNWTCGISNSAGSQTSSTTRIGRYTKIGRVVHVSVNMNNIEAQFLTGGSLRITGLPFTINVSSGARGHGVCQVNSFIDSNAHYYYIQGVQGTNMAQIKYNKNNDTAHSVDVDKLNSNSTSTIIFDLTYIV